MSFKPTNLKCPNQDCGGRLEEVGEIRAGTAYICTNHWTRIHYGQPQCPQGYWLRPRKATSIPPHQQNLMRLQKEELSSRVE